MVDQTDDISEFLTTGLRFKIYDRLGRKLLEKESLLISLNDNPYKERTPILPAKLSLTSFIKENC